MPVTVKLGSTDFSSPQERVLVGNFSIDTSKQAVRVESDPGPVATTLYACVKCDAYRAEVERLTGELAQATWDADFYEERMNEEVQDKVKAERERDEARERLVDAEHKAGVAQAKLDALARWAKGANLDNEGLVAQRDRLAAALRDIGAAPCMQDTLSFKVPLPPECCCVTCIARAALAEVDK